jgi:hypothetical protein
MSKKMTERGKTPVHLKARRGRPPVHQEAWAKVSVVLFERQVASLDRLTHTVRKKIGKTMTRAEIIRALIDGLIASRIDITKHASEATLREHVVGRLTERRPAARKLTALQRRD